MEHESPSAFHDGFDGSLGDAILVVGANTAELCLGLFGLARAEIRLS
jgi:hypothetical protein